MPEDDVSAKEVSMPLVLTGSTGTNPLVDGTMRTLIPSIPAGILAFLHVEYGILSTEGFAAIEAVLVPGGIILWALFDKYIKPKLITP